MIRFRRSGTKVVVHVETGLPHESEGCTTTFLFSYNTESVQYASLLCDYLNDRLTSRIKSVRKQEFSSGWKHGKAKKRGRSRFGWFYSSLTNRATHE